MRPSAEQFLLLEMVANKKQQLDDCVFTVRYTIEKEIERRTASIRLGYEDAVIAAKDAGVSKARIARASGVVNTTSVREIIRRAEIAHRAAVSERYERFGLDVLFVKLTGPGLLAATAATGWTAAEAVSMGTDSARFLVHDASLESLTPSFVEAVGLMHPVVWHVRQNPAEALSWWKEMGK